MKLHTVYKGTLSGVLFALIVQKILSVIFFYTSTATDASDKYEVWSSLSETLAEDHFSPLSQEAELGGEVPIIDRGHKWTSCQRGGDTLLGSDQFVQVQDKML